MHFLWKAKLQSLSKKQNKTTFIQNVLFKTHSFNKLFSPQSMKDTDDIQVTTVIIISICLSTALPPIPSWYILLIIISCCHSLLYWQINCPTNKLISLMLILIFLFLWEVMEKINRNWNIFKCEKKIWK